MRYLKDFYYVGLLYSILHQPVFLAEKVPIWEYLLWITVINPFKVEKSKSPKLNPTFSSVGILNGAVGGPHSFIFGWWSMHSRCQALRHCNPQPHFPSHTKVQIFYVVAQEIPSHRRRPSSRSRERLRLPGPQEHQSAPSDRTMVRFHLWYQWPTNRKYRSHQVHFVLLTLIG